MVAVLSVLGYGCSLASDGFGRLRGEWQRCPCQPFSSPGPSSWRQPRPASCRSKNNLAAVVGQGRVTGESMSHQAIRFQRLSSERSHYFWANYLWPHVNNQPDSVKTTMCSQLGALVLSPTLDLCGLHFQCGFMWLSLKAS